MGISLGTVSNIIKKLNSENIIEIKTNNKYSIIGLVNWELYQTQVESTIENELKPK
jgi:DNA-binding transcriptional regulator LsrR (DeoR family)